MTMNRSAAAATIFSRKCAPPPPLISQPSGATWSAPSIAMSRRSTLVERPDLDVELPSVPLGLRRGGDAVDRELARGERREQEGDRGAGSEPHLRPILHELGGGLGGHPLFGVDSRLVRHGCGI